MSMDLENRSDEEEAEEVLKPIADILAGEIEELNKVDEIIREAERKGKPILDPEL